MSDNNNTKAIVMIGNLNDGYSAVGPFNSFDEAAEWTEGIVSTADSWIMTLTSPIDDENDIPLESSKFNTIHSWIVISEKAGCKGEIIASFPDKKEADGYAENCAYRFADASNLGDFRFHVSHKEDIVVNNDGLVTNFISESTFTPSEFE